MSRALYRWVDLCVGLLLLLQLVTCMSAIAMLSRQTAELRLVFDRITAHSVELDRTLLATARLLDPSSDLPPPDLTRLSSSLGAANSPASQELEKALAREAPSLLTRDRGAIERSLGLLTKLAEENRRQHRQTGHALGFQSRAAGWALVFFGVVGMLLAGFFRQLLTRNLVTPVLEVSRVLAARVRGDASIRLAHGVAAPPLLALNQVLSALSTLELREHDNQAHRALAAWLDRYAEPVALLDQHRAIVAMNRGCLALLAGPEGDSWRRLMAEPGPVAQLTLEVWNEEFSLCRLPAEATSHVPVTKREDAAD